MNFLKDDLMNIPPLQVLLTVRAEQHPVDGDPDTVEYVTDGVLYLTEDETGKRFELHYEESSLTGMEGVHTTVRCKGNRIEVDRDGSMESHMIFEQNRRHVSLYEMPFGCMSVATTATEVTYHLDKLNGHIKLCYDLEVENILSGHNSIEITYS